MKREPLTFSRWARILSVYFLTALAVALVAPWFGAVSISLRSVLDSIASGTETIEAMIFLQQRVPRVLLGLCVGAALGLAGAAFQALLRNPLATPYTLGVASAGAFAAALSLVWPALAVTAGPFSSTQIFALAGSSAAAVFIMLLARRVGTLSTNFLILAGVAVNLFCGSALLFLRFLADPHHLVAVDRWVMGGLVTVGYWEIIGLLPFLAVGGGILLARAHALNQMGFGEAIAGSRGINTQRLLMVSLIGGVLLTTGAFAVAGPIGFVGLVVPHAVRLVSGSDQRIVLPASALASGALLVLCDTIARTCIAPTEIPVGIITAFFGAPVFLALLARRCARKAG